MLCGLAAYVFTYPKSASFALFICNYSMCGNTQAGVCAPNVTADPLQHQCSMKHGCRTCRGFGGSGGVLSLSGPCRSSDCSSIPSHIIITRAYEMKKKKQLKSIYKHIHKNKEFQSNLKCKLGAHLLCYGRRGFVLNSKEM